MSITRPPAMTPEEAERMISEAQRRGANIRMEDPRFTALMYWFLGIVGTALVAGIGLILSSQSKTNDTIAQINQNIAIMIQRQDFNDRVNAQQDKHMEAIDTRVDRHSERLNSLERFHPDQVIRRAR